MRLLIFTQKIDKNDAILGFFHTWVLKMSKFFKEITVVCLEKRNFDFPSNVKIYSLGKESGLSKTKYLINFYKNLYELNGRYDSVFIHMNEEYVLLGGLYWRIKKIPIYFWRNHKKGSFLTYVAVLFSNKVFCTSKDSFTAKFSKTKIMPVGNDSEFFKPISGVVRKKYSVCMLGRVAPVKNIKLGLEAINVLIKSGFQVSFHIVGPSDDDSYYENLLKYVKENNIESFVNFQNEADFSDHPKLYSSFEIFLNLTDSGSFDKSIVGATSCGAIPIVSNKSLVGMLPNVCITKNDKESIAESIKILLNPHEQIKITNDLKRFADLHSLDLLMEKLTKEII